MKNRSRILIFLGFSLVTLFLSLALIYAIPIGISPQKIYLNESVNKTLTLLNPNNETIYFTIKSTNNFVSFNKVNKGEEKSEKNIEDSVKKKVEEQIEKKSGEKIEGKIKSNSKENIIVLINPYQSFEKGVYDDIILVNAFENKGANFKNSIGIKVMINITEDINATDYYFYDENNDINREINLDGAKENQELKELENTTNSNLITGMAVFYNGNIKDNNWINLIVVIIFIAALYFFVKEKRVEEEKGKEKNNQENNNKKAQEIEYEY